MDDALEARQHPGLAHVMDRHPLNCSKMLYNLQGLCQLT